MALNSYKLDYVITPMTKAIYHEIISVITVKGYNCTVHVWITEKKKKNSNSHAANRCLHLCLGDHLSCVKHRAAGERFDALHGTYS